MTDLEPDDRLLDRFRRGDAAAFETIFARCYAAVYRAAYGLVRRHDEAEDLAQEAFLALARRPPAPLPGRPLTAWLCRVALNLGFNALRGQRREEARIELAAPPAPEADPHEALLRAEERALVRLALAQLPERQARLLALRYAGLSYAEIAAAIDVAPTSIGALLARAERAFLAAYTALEREPATQARET